MINAIVSQYKSSLKMLKDTIVKCPESLWEDGARYENAYWRIVYHTLFFTGFYLSESENTFKPWAKHKPGYHALGTHTHDKKPVIITGSYSKDELMDYADLLFNSIEDAVKNTINNEKSGFEWLPFNKLETHLYIMRHIQHHTGQLVERLHQNGIKGIDWVGFVKP